MVGTVAACSGGLTSGRTEKLVWPVFADAGGFTSGGTW